MVVDKLKYMNPNRPFSGSRTTENSLKVIIKEREEI